MKSFQDIQPERESIRRETTRYLKPALGDPQALGEACEQALRLLTERCGNVSDYLFTICATDLAGRYGERVAPSLQAVFSRYFDLSFKYQEDYEPCPERKLSFAAFYTLLTYFIDNGRMEAVDEIFTNSPEAIDITRYFSDFALFHDILSRYYKRGRDEKSMRMALEENEIALENLAADGFTNAGVSCSYASTVCRLLDNGLSVRPRTLEQAQAAISTSLSFNPDYAKYHAINAQLIYHRCLLRPGDRTNMTELETALDEISFAIRREDTHRQDNERRVSQYRSLKEKIAELYRTTEEQLQKEGASRIISQERLAAFKQEILLAEDDHSCHLPELCGSNEDYVFICYSRSDFRQVFCDALELFARGIPSRFDKEGSTMKHGADWDQVVRQRILDAHCKGVIFFLGSRTLLSQSLEEEQLIIREKAGLDGDLSRVMFSINLTNKTASRLLIDTIREQSPEELASCGVDDERLRTFLSIFTDKRDFIPRDEDPLSLAHMDTVVSAIQYNFGITGKKTL